jgi:hypothetical protein
MSAAERLEALVTPKVPTLSAAMPLPAGHAWCAECGASVLAGHACAADR